MERRNRARRLRLQAERWKDGKQMGEQMDGDWRMEVVVDALTCQPFSMNSDEGST